MLPTLCVLTEVITMLHRQHACYNVASLLDMLTGSCFHGHLNTVLLFSRIAVSEFSVGTCESEIFVQIESRIGGYNSNLNQGVVVYAFSDDHYRRSEMCGFSWFLKQNCTIAPTVLASVYALATQT